VFDTNKVTESPSGLWQKQVTATVYDRVQLTKTQETMKTIRNMFSTAMLGLTVVVLPLTVVLVLAAKAYRLFQGLFQPLLRLFEGQTVAGLALYKLVYLILLLFLCYLAGKLAHTKAAKRLINWIEDSILVFVPGYQFIKSTVHGTTGFEERKVEVVMVKVDDPWQMAFLIEEIYPGMYTVFVPGAPNVASGDVYHVEERMMMRTNITQQQAMRSMRQMGYGSAVFLRELKLHE
jgi:uncharacterized membrane protein